MSRKRTSRSRCAPPPPPCTLFSPCVPLPYSYMLVFLPPHPFFLDVPFLSLCTFSPLRALIPTSVPFFSPFRYRLTSLYPFCYICTFPEPPLSPDVLSVAYRPHAFARPRMGSKESTSFPWAASHQSRSCGARPTPSWRIKE